MFPHEAQELMAKILFFVFAACILCLSKVNAEDYISFERLNLHEQTISSPYIR
jgi:hypothetical protein